MNLNEKRPTLDAGSSCVDVVSPAHGSVASAPAADELRRALARWGAGQANGTVHVVDRQGLEQGAS